MNIDFDVNVKDLTDVLTQKVKDNISSGSIKISVGILEDGIHPFYSASKRIQNNINKYSSLIQRAKIKYNLGKMQDKLTGEQIMGWFGSGPLVSSEKRKRYRKLNRKLQAYKRMDNIYKIRKASQNKQVRFKEIYKYWNKREGGLMGPLSSNEAYPDMLEAAKDYLMLPTEQNKTILEMRARELITSRIENGDFGYVTDNTMFHSKNRSRSGLKYIDTGETLNRIQARVEWKS